MESYFFLSYARADDDGAVIARFYQDLRAELARRDPEAGRQPSFRDVEEIFLGADWERKLSQAISGCRALVALYSPAYFASVYCGKEWTAFRARTAAYQRETGWDPGALLPVLWEPVPGGPPEPVGEVQYREPAMGERYAELGLRRLLAEEPEGPDCRRVIEVLAERVSRAAGRIRLPSLSGLNLRELQGVFPVEPSPPAPSEPVADTPAPPSHLFVSYAPAERMWAEWAVGELTALGYRSSLHSLSRSTDGPSEEIDWTLAGQGRVVALLSGDYLRHPRAAELWRALAGHEVARGVSALVPLRVRELDGPLPRLFAERPVGDLVGSTAADSTARLATAVGRLPTAAPPTGGEPARHPGALPEVLDVPARNTAFTGRDGELEALREGFTGGGRTVQVVTGLGGVGKTQTAAEYAHRFRAGYDLIWWIAAQQVEYLAPQLAALAPWLGLETGDDSADTAGRVLAALHRGEPYRRWLLVLDNAGPPEQLTRWLLDGPVGGHVLITSRDPGWNRRAAVLELGVFRRSESLRLLRRHNPGLSEQSAGQVAGQLGDLPLAIAQAAAWLQESGMPVAGYLDLLSVTLTEILDRTRLPEAEYPRSVAATWLLSLEELRRGNARAADLLEVCAHFGPEPIPTALLFSPPLLHRLGLGRDPLSARLELGELVRTIHRTGLARADAGRESLTVHRLVQAVVRDQVPEERRGELRRTAQLALAAVAPQDPDAADTWQAFAELLPHLWPSGAADSGEAEVRQLLVNAVRHLWKTGLGEEARELAERTLEGWSEASPDGGRVPSDGLYAGMLRVQLANVLRDQGEFQESYAIDRAAHDRFRRELGPRHLQTLIAASNLGCDLRMLGRLQEARVLDQESLEAGEQSLGRTHPRVVMMTHNLGVSEALAGNWGRALDLYRRGYLGQRRLFGPTDPRALVDATTYGMALQKTGRLREALELLEVIVQTYRRTVSRRYTGGLFAGARLAAAYYRFARYDEAGELAYAAHEGFLEMIGRSSWYTLSAANTLAAVRHAQDDVAAAVRTAALAHRAGQDHYGGDHPIALGLAANLAVHLRGAGSTGEARALADAAVAGLTQALGAEHCYLGPALVNQATALADRGDPDRAVTLGRRAARLLVTAFGPSHYDVLTARANLALDLAALGHQDQAAELTAACTREATAALGAGHPLTRAVAAGERLSAHLDLCDL
ncbi:FxSxx-COOH system tetratricopeptide repeat protein [Kitasatospora acidiphila]|uniref:FxSxx-COOH system tetratricopeptide repeat protein n=1 Tax=Kitasatospora acidiphila TaxID=2567942 RepID=UPI003C770A06